MKTIYKYKLPLEAFQVYDRYISVQVPGYRTVLDVQLQDNVPTVWIECDPDAGEKTLLYFYIVGTGAEIPHRAAFYAGTAQLNGFVWHFYYDYEASLDES